MDERELSDLIRRVKSGNATEEERLLLEARWLEALNDTSPVDALTEADRQELKSKIFLATKTQIVMAAKRDKDRARRQIVWRSAAAVVLLLGVTALLYWQTNRLTEVQADYGEHVSVTLPDKSRVVLNGNSKLRYPRRWHSGEAREVYLEGEAFFIVQHTANHDKFVVHASNLNVQVLGTKFNVTNRQHKLEVMLAEGKVMLDILNADRIDSANFACPWRTCVHPKSKGDQTRGEAASIHVMG